MRENTAAYYTTTALDTRLNRRYVNWLCFVDFLLSLSTVLLFINPNQLSHRTKGIAPVTLIFGDLR